jgi:predicted translin family RNA/ssDNA-binding protein
MNGMLIEYYTGTCFQVPSEIDGIRQRMDEIDALREEVIKQSRDIQKMSKQAIYATHRNNLQEAETKLNKCEGILDKIMIIVNEVSFECVPFHAQC